VTAGTLLARIVPPPLVRIRAQRLLERNVLVYRRSWLIVLSGFFEPVFYLFSIGIGIGQLVDDIALPGGAVSYTAYIAPALLAASAMNGAVFESTMNIFFKLKYGKVYDAMLSTPLQPWDIAIGEITWSLLRVFLYSAGFMVVMAVMGLVTSPMALLAIPAATVIGFAFGSVGMASTTFMKSWQHFDLVTLVTMPIFLFSGTFFPLDVYPRALQYLVQLSPLYHGIELIRAFTLNQFDITVFGHLAFLLSMGAIGIAVAGRRLEGLLKP
jgi:lipooligosaccharide transport system permease protein